jgi:SAM-dependent methyltransferase
MNLIPADNGFLCPDDPGEPGLGAKRWSVNPIEARIVSELCRGLDVLEIGTGLGISTKAIAKRARVVYTVDIDPWVKETVVPDLPENVKFFDNIQDIPHDLDVVFIDGLHSFQQCNKDIRDARKVLKPDGLYIFHDAKMSGVANAIKGSGLTIVPIETSMGMVMAWKE